MIAAYSRFNQVALVLSQNGLKPFFGFKPKDIFVIVFRHFPKAFFSCSRMDPTDQWRLDLTDPAMKSAFRAMLRRGNVRSDPRQFPADINDPKFLNLMQNLYDNCTGVDYVRIVIEEKHPHLKEVATEEVLNRSYRLYVLSKELNYRVFKKNGKWRFKSVFERPKRCSVLHRFCFLCFSLFPLGTAPTSAYDAPCPLPS